MEIQLDQLIVCLSTIPDGPNSIIHPHNETKIREDRRENQRNSLVSVSIVAFQSKLLGI